jgi:hypothetical protein
VITPATKFYVDPHSKAAKQALLDFGNGDIENATNMARLELAAGRVGSPKARPTKCASR